jgi:hypothetical protein
LAICATYRISFKSPIRTTFQVTYFATILYAIDASNISAVVDPFSTAVFSSFGDSDTPAFNISNYTTNHAAFSATNVATGYVSILATVQTAYKTT